MRESTADMSDTTSGRVRNGDRLVTYLQPFYNLSDDTLQGFEALVRHVRDDGTVGSAGQMLATAEATGEMHAIDLATLDDALAFKAQYRAAHPDHRSIVSVNLSWDVVSSPLLVMEVTGALRRHRVTGDRLLVDITAGIFRRLLDSDAKAFSRLGDLQTAEVTLCLDGFTSTDLDLLPAAAAVPVDIIKLHPSLVAGEKRDELAVIAAAVQEVGLPIVAAGVESEDELDLVRDLGFEWAQGFHLGAPVAAERALELPLALHQR